MSSSYSTILELLFVYGLACRRVAPSYVVYYEIQYEYRTANYGTIRYWLTLRNSKHNVPAQRLLVVPFRAHLRF
jgi:hypothetical protein